MSARPIYSASAGRGGVPIRGSAPTGYGSTSSLSQGYSPEVLAGSTTVSEVVNVPAALADFAADGKFNEIMLNIKKQTNINHIDRKMEGGVCKHIHISAPSNETGNNARKLVETHFKNRIKLMEREALVDKIQNDLFSAQGEVASGMMVDFIIPTSAIGLVIGKAGQRIKAIKKETGISSINVDGNTGKVIVVGPDARSVQAARERLQLEERSFPVNPDQLDYYARNYSNGALSDLKDQCDLLVARTDRDKGCLTVIGSFKGLQTLNVILPTNMAYADMMIEAEMKERAAREATYAFNREMGIINRAAGGGGRGDYGGHRGRGGDYSGRRGRGGEQRDYRGEINERKASTSNASSRALLPPSATQNKGKAVTVTPPAPLADADAGAKAGKKAKAPYAGGSNADVNSAIAALAKTSIDDKKKAAPAAPDAPVDNNKKNNNKKTRGEAREKLLYGLVNSPKAHDGAIREKADNKHEPKSGIDTAQFCAANPKEQKVMLGERLHALILPHHEKFAGKITGMFLELDNADIINLIEHPDALLEKIDEALGVLKKHRIGTEIEAISYQRNVVAPVASAPVTPAVTATPVVAATSATTTADTQAAKDKKKKKKKSERKSTDGEVSPTPTVADISFGTYLLNTRKAEDATPRVFTTEDGRTVFGCVVDGHDGRKVTDYMNDLPDDVFAEIPANPEAWVQRRKKECKKMMAGAMITVFTASLAADGEAYDVTIVARGDVGLSLILPNGDVIKKKDHVLAEGDPVPEGVKLVKDDLHIWKPYLCGPNDEFRVLQSLTIKATRALDTLTHKTIATFAVIGDLDSFCHIPSEVLRISVPVGTRLVAASDGIWDVMHHEDPLFRTETDLTLLASQLATECQQRWTTRDLHIYCLDTFNASGDMKFVGKTRDLGADDISVIVVDLKTKCSE